MSLIKHRRKRITLGLVFGTLLVCCLLFLDPRSLPAPFLFVPFGLFFCASFLLLRELLSFASQKLHAKLSSSRVARIAFAFSGLPTFLLLIQSVGQVRGYDIIISLILFGAIDFYLARSPFAAFRDR